ncbi:hypothetical protein WME95_45550 [Sorangium sp. So ce327]|uniref:hypothetical protein n=1 Tax=Sorangium sp. So ce327 TaxID=3133301 RepID=UPI003F6075D1
MVEPLSEVRRLGSLSFAKRGRALALLARGWDQATADRVMAALDGGDGDERRLALDLATYRRDVARIERALRDPMMRRAALSSARRVPVSDEALLQVLREGNRREARGVVMIMQRRRLVAQATAVIPLVIARHGVGLATRLFATCDLDTLEHHAAEYEAAWRELLARAPERALRVALATRRKITADEGTLFCTRTPREALALLVRRDALHASAIHALVMACPAELLEVLRRNDWTVSLSSGPPPSGSPPISTLPAEDVLELRSRCKPLDASADPLFRFLPLTERERLLGAELEQAAKAAWSPRRGMDARLATMPPASVTRLTAAALSPPVDPDTRRKRLQALEKHLDLAQLRSEHEALGVATDRGERAARMVALVRSLRRGADPATCASVLAEVEPAWHGSSRHLVMAELAQLSDRQVSEIPVQTYRDALLTTVQSRDSNATTLAQAERAVHKAIGEAILRDSITRAAQLLGLLVQIRLDPRVRWRADKAPAPGYKPPSTEYLPSPLRIAESLAARLHAAYEGVRLDGTTPMLGPVAVGRYEPEAERLIVDLLLGRAPKTPRPPRKPVTCNGPLDEVMGYVPEISLKETALVDALLDRDDTTDPHKTDLVAAISRSAPGRWTPSQRRRFTQHLLRVARDASLDLSRRVKAIGRVEDAPLLIELLPGAAGPVAAAILARCARIAPPTAELRRLFLERARRSGVVGRAAMSALNVLSERMPGPFDLAPYRELLLSKDCAVVNRKNAAGRVSAAATVEARDLLMEAWRSEDLHPSIRPDILAGLLRFVDQADVRQVLIDGITTMPDTWSLLNPGSRLLFPNESQARPAVARGFVALAEALVECGDERIASTAAGVCIAQHDLCSEGLGLATRLLAEARTPGRVLVQAVESLSRLPNDAGLPHWQAALARLVAAASGGRTWAAARLARLAPRPRAFRIALGLVQKAAGLRFIAAASLKEILDVDLVEVRFDKELWSEYLALVDEQPARRSPSTGKLKDPGLAASLIDWLIQHGGLAAALSAAELSLQVEKQLRDSPAWRGRLDAIRAMHADAAERLLLADT